MGAGAGRAFGLTSASLSPAMKSGDFPLDACAGLNAKASAALAVRVRR
jgi:hypothetical protein